MFGGEFADVHRWLDAFFSSYGPRHRKFRHHRQGVEQVRAMWGDLAAEAAELHIVQDMFNLPVPDDIDYIGGDGSWPVGDKWNSTA